MYSERKNNTYFPPTCYDAKYISKNYKITVSEYRLSKTKASSVSCPEVKKIFLLFESISDTTHTSFFNYKKDKHITWRLSLFGQLLKKLKNFAFSFGIPCNNEKLIDNFSLFMIHLLIKPVI